MPHRPALSDCAEGRERARGAGRAHASETAEHCVFTVRVGKGACASITAHTHNVEAFVCGLRSIISEREIAERDRETARQGVAVEN